MILCLITLLMERIDRRSHMRIIRILSDIDDKERWCKRNQAVWIDICLRLCLCLCLRLRLQLHVVVGVHLVVFAFQLRFL